MRRTMLVASIVLCVVAYSQDSISSESGSSGEMNFLFCDIGFNNDALIEIKIKKPDGKVYSRIGVYGLSDHSVRMFRNDSEQNMESPKYSTDARKIIFSIYDRQENVSAAILDVDTGNYKEISEGHSVKLHPTFAPDNKEIVYWVPEATKRGKYVYWLYKLNLTTGLETKLVAKQFYEQGHIVSLPSKKIIAFGSTQLGGEKWKNKESIRAGYVADTATGYTHESSEIFTDYGGAPSILSASNTEVICLSIPTNRLQKIGGYYAYNVYALIDNRIFQVTNYVPGKDRVMIRHAAISRDGKRIIFESYPSVANHAPFYNTLAKFFGAEVSKPSETEFGTFIVNIDGSNKKRIVIIPPIRPIVQTIHRLN